MTTAQLRNLLIYCAVAGANMLAIAVTAALATGTLPGFRDGEFLAPAGSSLATLLAVLAPILTTWLAANRPRFGSEGLSQQVSDLQAGGTSRAEMVVLSQDDAAAALAGQIAAMSPEGRHQLLARLESTLSKEGGS